MTWIRDWGTRSEEAEKTASDLLMTSMNSVKDAAMYAAIDGGNGVNGLFRDEWAPEPGGPRR